MDVKLGFNPPAELNTCFPSVNALHSIIFHCSLLFASTFMSILFPFNALSVLSAPLFLPFVFPHCDRCAKFSSQPPCQHCTLNEFNLPGCCCISVSLCAPSFFPPLSFSGWWTMGAYGSIGRNLEVSRTHLWFEVLQLVKIYIWRISKPWQVLSRKL